MKKLAMLLFISLIAHHAFAEENLCSNLRRTTTTDQKAMVIATALTGLAIDKDDILYLGSSDYVSWKGEQQGCLADVLHYSKIKIIYKPEANKRCEVNLNLHAKDHFLKALTVGSEREMKMRDLQETCYEEDSEMQAQTKTCAEAPACPYIERSRQVKDYFDNCKCKMFLDLVRFEDQGSSYDDFFNPNKKFPKPENLTSPFERK